MESVNNEVENLKIMKNVAILSMFLITLSMVSGAFAADQNSDLTPIKQNINVNVNEKFTIVLPSNPSTGYSWTPLYSAEYLNLESRDFIPSQGGLIGASGTEKFVFKAVKSGETDLSLYYNRIWDPEPWIEPCDTVYPVFGNWRFYHVTITE